MIDYVDAKLRIWGLAKRKLVCPHSKLLTKPDKNDKPVSLKTMASGNARSFIGRFREGGHVGKGSGISRLVEPLEGLQGDALQASIAIQLAIQAKNLHDGHYEQLFLHYVAKGKNRRKMKALNMDYKTYYGTLHNIHLRLKAWLDAAANRQEKLSKIMYLPEHREIA